MRDKKLKIAAALATLCSIPWIWKALTFAYWLGYNYEDL